MRTFAQHLKTYRQQNFAAGCCMMPVIVPALITRCSADCMHLYARLISWCFYISQNVMS